MTEIEKKTEVTKKIIELLKEYDDVDIQKFDDSGSVDFHGVTINFEFDKITGTEVAL